MRFSPFALLFAAAGMAVAQPVINAVENNFSYILPGLPNYGIAQGSIFVIFGANLAGTSSPLQAAPLQTQLDGVSVQITVAGSTTQALLYYVMPNQIGGVLPSVTPTGTGQITVTDNGQVSSSAPITVVQSAFGIALSPFSAEAASAFDADWNPLSSANAANPGDVIVFFGSGAGPISTNDALTPPVQNLTGVPIEVDIGGVPSTVLYHGRTGFPGLDQINAVIPPGVSGCSVSLAIVSSGLVSNFALLPIAQQGRTCTDQVPGVTLPIGPRMPSGTSVTVGQLFLYRTVQDVPLPLSGPPVRLASMTEEYGSGWFQRMTDSTPFRTAICCGGVFPSLRSCLVHSSQSPLPGAEGATAVAARSQDVRAEISDSYVNGGPAINFAGPNGMASAPLRQDGTYLVTFTGPASNPPPFLPTSGGTITLDNGSGGPDVGPFQTQIAAPPPIVWTNLPAIPLTIDRTQGFTVTWSGGNPTGFVSITATATIVNGKSSLQTVVSCTAPNADGQFTIPASAMLTLPPSSAGPPSPIALTNNVVVATRDQFPFTAPGLDAGVVEMDVQFTFNAPIR
jgi:uncharacterized protein (TIGR03437 family)